MTTTDALERTLDLVSFGWTQGATARDVNGKSVPCNHPRAVQYSLDGAIQWATWPDLAPDPEEEKLWKATERCFSMLAWVAGQTWDGNSWSYLIKWNDTRGRTKDEVLELVREALQKGSEE